MKNKILISFCFTAIFLRSSAQVDSIGVFNQLLCKSTLSYVQKDYKKSIYEIHEAQKYHKLYPFSHLILAECYLSINEIQRAIDEIDNAILKGVTDEKLRNYFASYSELKNNDFWENLASSYPALRKKYYSSLNIDMVVSIGQILERDQFVRNNEGQIEKRNCNINNLFSFVDSLNYSAFIDLVDKNGFPTYNQIGYYSQIDVLIAHWIMEDSRYERLNGMMLEAIKKGEFDPQSYAWIIDRRIIWKNIGKAKYGGFENPMEFGEIEDIKNVDRRRALIYLPSLEMDSKITQRELPKDYKSGYTK